MGAGSAWRGNPQGVAEPADGTDSGHHADGPDMFRAAHTTGRPSFVELPGQASWKARLTPRDVRSFCEDPVLHQGRLPLFQRRW